MTNLVEAATLEFHLRYFDWCVQQTHLEAEDAFGRAKRICGYYAGIFQEFLDEFGTVECLNLCQALLKRTHMGVLQLRGESLSPSDRLIIDRFNAFARPGAVMRIPRVIRDRWPDETEAEPEDKLNADEIRSVLSFHLSEHLGPPVKRGARGLLEFRHTINGWTIFTNVTAEEDAVQWSIRYAHTISVRSDLDGELIGTSISYLAWLGLPATQWDYVSRKDLTSVASMLIDFIQIFISAAPRLLADIKNPVKVC